MKEFMIRDPVIKMNEEKPRQGEWKHNNSGSYMEIINYRGSHDIDVGILTRMSNGDCKYYVKEHQKYKNFTMGCICSIYDRDARTLESRVGEKRLNTYGSTIEILEYDTSKNIKVKIDTILESGELKTFIQDHLDYKDFSKGYISSPYDKCVCGVGYYDIGEYNPTNSPICYMHWKSMIDRCYSTRKAKNLMTYIDSSVVPYFHSFQNFSKWYNENYYSFGDLNDMELDKDILYKRNNIYNPETCCFVSHYINSLFIKSNSTRGKYPIGVRYDKSRDKYRARTRINKIEKDLGRFPTPEAAFDAYKVAKEDEIKRVANYYWNEKGGQFIPQFKRVYKAMMNYTVEITD